jgi:hypothetical protein
MGILRKPEGEEAMMKTTFIRTLAVAMLATSLSAFARIDDTKRDDAATKCNTTQQDRSSQKTGDPAKQDKSSNSQNEDQEQQEFDYMLMGIYG